MVKTTLQQVYDELLYREMVKNKSDFADKLNYDRGHISRLLGSDKPIPHKIQQILHKDFGVSREWLESNGVAGDMLDAEMLTVRPGKSKEVIALGRQVPLRLKPDEYSDAFGDWKGLPMYNAPITASFIETYRDDTLYQPQYYLHDPRFRDCTFGAIITGDSMHSEIRHGDFVVCKEITDKSFIVFGDIYYVVTTNGLETCKYINADRENPNNWMLVPRNENISSSPIPKNMVLKLYKVRGIVRGY